MSEDIAWAAGFIEGEGHIRVSTTRGKYKSPCITVGQCHRDSLDELKRIFGGQVYGPYSPAKPNWSSFYTYQINGKLAQKAIELILPYLFQKGNQARKVIEEMREYHE